MDWILLWSLAVKIVLALGGLWVAGRIAIRWLAELDRRAQINFRADAWGKIKTDARATALYLGARIIAIAGAVAFVLGMALSSFAVVMVAPAPAEAALIPKTYDKDIRRAADRFMPGVPWPLFKSQLWQESRLDPTARSPAGAEGLAQFMPKTAAEIFPLLGYGAVDRRLAGPSIEAAALYMSRLRAARKAGEWNRHKLALASYNAGGGNINRAIRACGGELSWAVARECLPQITGRHSDETIGYVRLIFDKWWPLMQIKV